MWTFIAVITFCNLEYVPAGLQKLHRVGDQIGSANEFNILDIFYLFEPHDVSYILDY